jgi:acetylornithine deacetylase/succinyl-diaminopimelate desuccinylase-like protein
MSTVRRPILWILLGAIVATALAVWVGRKPRPRAGVELAQIRSAEEWLSHEPVRLLRDFIRIETTEKTGEKAGAEFLREIFECDGIESEIVCPAPERCNLLARLPGKRREGALLLLNHIDTFSYEAQFWKEAAPLEGKITGGFLYGRGAYDMKSTGIAQALALREVKRLGIEPEADILFLAEADEEFGQKWGARWLLENRPEWFEGVRYVVNEGGVNEMILRDVRFWGVETLQTGTAWAELEGAQEKPLADLAASWKQLDGGKVPPDPQIRVAFDMVANHAGYPLNEHLRNLDAVRNDPVKMAEIPDRYGAFLEPRIFWSPVFPYPLDKPDRHRVVLVISTPPAVSPQPYLDRILEQARKSGLRIERSFSSEATEASRWAGPDGKPAPILGLIRDSIEARFPGVPFGPIPTYGVYTSSVLFRRRGFETYGWTPIALNITDAARRHANDERIFLDDFLVGVEMYKDFLAAFALWPGEQEVSVSRPRA